MPPSLNSGSLSTEAIAGKETIIGQFRLLTSDLAAANMRGEQIERLVALIVVHIVDCRRPPACRVNPPWGISGTPCSDHRRNIAATCSVVRGRATVIGRDCGAVVSILKTGRNVVHNPSDFLAPLDGLAR